MTMRTLIALCVLLICVILSGFTGSVFNVGAESAFAQNSATVRCANGIPEVTLSWTPSADVSYYRVQRKTAAAGTFSILDSQIKTTNYLDIRWKSDYGVSSYVYRIQAVRVTTTTSIINSNEVSIPVPECRVLPTSTVNKFIVGDRIEVRKDQPALNVRASPMISAQVIGTQGASAVGTILDGPVYDGVNKYWFWKVNFDSGVDGWSVEYWINRFVSGTTVSPPSPQPSPPPSTTTTSAKMPSWMKWGVYAGWSNTAMLDFETLTGKQPNMEMVFVHWGNEPDFPSYYGGRIRDKGRTMVLFWEASDYKRDPFSQPEYSLDAVLAGTLDSYFAHFAAGAKAYGGQVIIIPYSEMNGNWYPWGGTIGSNTPQKVITGYRYIHSFFAGTSNVKFGWAPNNDSVPNTAANQMEQYYPGDDVVDYVGVDGFNFGGTSEQTFNQMFGSVLTRLKQYKKPIYIFSAASAASPSKAAWIKNALTVELYKYPEVAGWLWFNQNKERDWRINSDPASLSTFLSALP